MYCQVNENDRVQSNFKVLELNALSLLIVAKMNKTIMIFKIVDRFCQIAFELME